ncbi:hypothetical protein AMS68_006747 [Peltaster fructicola]|uniref:BZIP domain-containing protein n=1 Tax=Peltaster fructicola TaxID=286661 RepID=A0A6H0Y3M2_9PEZI|nr:hypothetical protein AMS68_006747 [Peltaster fructicola]
MKSGSMEFDTPYGMAISRTQSIAEAPFDVGEFLTESTSPDSIDEHLCQASSMLLNGGLESTSAEPKKARRQAQNRAAQRAFRERKEKYIQQLEEQVLDMRKEITTLSQDRRRFESLLKIARAEIKTLKSLPQQLTSHLRTDIDRDHLECKVHGLGARRTVVLTIDLGVGGVKACTQSERKGVCDVEADNAALESMSEDG